MPKWYRLALALALDPRDRKSSLKRASDNVERLFRRSSMAHSERRQYRSRQTRRSRREAS